jgi:hypothetical protein
MFSVVVQFLVWQRLVAESFYLKNLMAGYQPHSARVQRGKIDKTSISDFLTNSILKKKKVTLVKE